MACINMFNPDHPAGHPMSPRISFSNDFSVDPPPPPSSSSSSSAPRRSTSDPDFEFSVGSRPMMAADELFFKGRMLPLRGGESGCINSRQRVTTLRDELQAQDLDGWDSARPPKGSAMRWKEFLGLKKTPSSCGAPGKKSERDAAEGSTGKNNLQEQCSDGRSAAKDVDMGF